MSQVKESPVTEKVPWISLTIIMVLSAVIGTLWIYFGGTAVSPYSEFGGFVNYAQPLTITPFLIFLIGWPLTKINYFKSKINPRTLGYIYIATIFISFGSSSQYLYSWQTFICSRFEDPVQSLQYVSSIMAPSSEICYQFMTGRGIMIPWGEWLPRIIFWWFFYTMPVLFLMSVDTLFRRQWIDVEQLPTPHTLIAHESLIQTSSGPSLLSKRSFLIGFIIGVAFSFPLMMIKFFPWFPDIYGWKSRTCCGGVWYTQGGDPWAGIAGVSTLQKNPLQIAIAYLIPLKILFNAWFWYLVYVILMQITFAMGYYTGIDSEGGCGRAWCAPTTGLMGPPLKFHAISLVGGLIGITLGTLWLSRRYLLTTLKAAFGGFDKNQVSEMESKEAMSYRSIWLMVVLTSIGFVLVFLVEGMGLEAALVMLLSCFVFQLASIRMYGLAGINPLSYEHGHAIYKMLMWPAAPQPFTTDYVLAQPVVREGMTCGTTHADAIGGGMSSGLASYKMAQLVGINNKNAFKVTLLSFAVMPIVGFVSFLWVGYTFGLNNVPLDFEGLLNFRNRAINASTWNSTPASDPWIQYALLGIVITLLLSILHARYVWFPFEPIGFICGTTYIDVLFGMWFPFLAAWALKTFTLRMGGSKAYEQYGVPIAVGFILGYIALTVLSGIISIFQFIHPF